jgi:signal transduction histidine kinase/CheY-like chemotaxis protein
LKCTGKQKKVTKRHIIGDIQDFLKKITTSAKKNTIITLGDVIREDFLQLVFVFLSFALMVLVSYLFVSDIVEKQIFVNAKEMLQTAETAIRSDFREAEVSLINTSLFVENGLESGWSEEELHSYLLWETEALIPDETGVPGFFNIFCYLNGKFISARRNWNPPPDYNPAIRPWFVAAKEAGDKVGYSSPYLDLITGEQVISLTRMMGWEENQWFIGVDLHLDPLFTYVNGLQSAQSGYGILMDQDFVLLVHPYSGVLGYKAAELSPGHAEMVKKLKENPGEVIVQQMPNWKGNLMVLVSKKLYNGWYLAIATPASRYYGSVNSMAIVLTILGLGLMTILCTFLIRLSFLKARSDEENRGKSSFLARMSHEIRTPMNSILGMAELIQRKQVSSEVQEYIGIIHQSGHTLLAIINDILDFSKIESGRLQIENRNYHLASVINDTINVIRPRAVEKSLDFFVCADNEIPAELIGDDVHFRQILINMLSNAVKYTHKGFIALEVTMELLENSTLRLTMAVHDSGVGIKFEDQGKLFAEFSRVDAASNQGIEGTGLGLVITKALARTMGGDITFTSEYGAGSTFRASIIQTFENRRPLAQVINPEQKKVLLYDWRSRYLQYLVKTFNKLKVEVECAKSFPEFMHALEHGDYNYAFISSKYAIDCIYILGRRSTLLQLVVMVEPGEVSVFREVSSIMMPVYAVTIANVLNDQSDGMLPQNKKLRIHFTAPSANVLIVDDISTNLRVAKELMSPYNMNIHTCMNGPDAIKLIKSHRYDIVFMDHMMPGMDGLEAVTFIRALETGSGSYKNLPIIMLTANAVSGQREMFLERGIDDFLAKPIDIQKLNDVLEKWLPEEKRIEAHRPQEDGKQELVEYLGISGVDTGLGLRNMGGNPAVYRDILINFCRDAETRMVKLIKSLESGNLKLYVTLVHALKSAARSIGAMETGNLAAWLEEKAEWEDTSLVRNKNADLLENIRALITNIRVAAQKTAGNGDISSLQLDDLKAALADMNIEEVNKMLLEYASMPLDGAVRNKVSEVEEHILMFEYDKAIEKIDELF